MHFYIHFYISHAFVAFWRNNKRIRSICLQSVSHSEQSLLPGRWLHALVLKPSSTRGLISRWSVIFHSVLLSDVLRTVSRYTFVRSVMFPNHKVFGRSLSLLPGRVPWMMSFWRKTSTRDNCVSWRDQSSATFCSSHTLTVISLLQYFLYCISKKTGPLRLIWHKFTTSQHLLIIFGRERPYSILNWYDKKFISWLRKSCVVTVTTVATWHTRTATGLT